MISKLKEPSKTPSSTLSLPYSEGLPGIVFQKPGKKMLTELRGTEKKWWFRDQAQLIRSSVHWNAKGDDVSAQGEENQFVTDWITSFCPRSTMPLPTDFMGSSNQSTPCHHQLESQGRKEENSNFLWLFQLCHVRHQLGSNSFCRIFWELVQVSKCRRKIQDLSKDPLLHSLSHQHVSKSIQAVLRTGWLTDRNLFLSGWINTLADWDSLYMRTALDPHPQNPLLVKGKA